MNRKSEQGTGNKRNLQKLSAWDKALYSKISITVTTQMDRNSKVRKKRRDGKFTFYVPVVTK